MKKINHQDTKNTKRFLEAKCETTRHTLLLCFLEMKNAFQVCDTNARLVLLVSWWLISDGFTRQT